MKTAVPLARTLVELATVADTIDGVIPTLNFFDQFSEELDPDGFRSGEHELWAAFLEAEAFHLEATNYPATKAVASYTAALLRDSRYSRMNRKSIFQSARRGKMRRLLQQVSACNLIFPASDLETIQEDLANAPVTTLSPNL